MSHSSTKYSCTPRPGLRKVYRYMPRLEHNKVGSCCGALGKQSVCSTEYDNFNSARTSAIDKLWYTPSLGRLGISPETPVPPTPRLVGYRYRTRKSHYQTRKQRTSTAIMSSPASSRRRGCNGTPARVLDSRLRRRHADSRS